MLELTERGYLLDATNDWYLYSGAEMGAVDEAILGYKDAIVRKKPGAKEAYDAYIAKRKAEVDPINEVLPLTASDVLFDILIPFISMPQLANSGPKS